MTDTSLVSGYPSTHAQVCLFSALLVYSGSTESTEKFVKMQIPGPYPGYSELGEAQESTSYEC